MKLTNTIRDAFIRSAMNDVPSIDYTEKARSLILADSISSLPPKIQAIAKDKALSHFVSAPSYYASGFGYIAAYCGRGADFKPSDACAAELAALKKAKDAQTERNSALRDKLKAVAYSVTTRKALADLLPEFAKYLPADEAHALRSVPVVANVVTDFVKAGWPKDKKAA